MRAVAETVDQLTPEWLTGALHHAGVECTVVEVAAERIGTGQIGTSYRLRLSYAREVEGAPGTLVAKLAGGDEAARRRVSEGYRKEVGFYTDIASSVDVRVPRCWYGAISDDACTFTLLLDDLAPARPGVQAEGCTVAQALDAVRNVAGLHAPRWNDDTLRAHRYLAPADEASAAFLGEIMRSAADEFLERYEARLADADPETIREVARALDTWAVAGRDHFSVVHGDYRLDNLMFPPAGDGVVALDWQTATLGPPARDVAYFLGTSLEVDERRRNEEAIVEAYHGELAGRGVRGYPLDRCFDDYRLGAVQGPMITVLGAVYATAERSPQSDTMFTTMARRSCAAVRDLKSLELL